jgi:hypothetical protein
MGKLPTITRLNAGEYKQIKLTKPICDYRAKNIEAVLPQLLALNAAEKTQVDAATALGLSVNTLRNYLAVARIKWRNVRRYTVNRIR